jgi:hypothetical protein
MTQVHRRRPGDWGHRDRLRMGSPNASFDPVGPVIAHLKLSPLLCPCVGEEKEGIGGKSRGVGIARLGEENTRPPRGARGRRRRRGGGWRAPAHASRPAPRVEPRAALTGSHSPHARPGLDSRPHTALPRGHGRGPAPQPPRQDGVGFLRCGAAGPRRVTRGSPRTGGDSVVLTMFPARWEGERGETEGEGRRS